jgi:hypothetical protein
MLSCREVQRRLTTSDGLPLSRSERIFLRMHLMLCRLCRRHRRQIETVDRVTRGLSEASCDFPPSDSSRLSLEARERIRRALRDS